MIWAGSSAVSAGYEQRQPQLPALDHEQREQFEEAVGPAVQAALAALDGAATGAERLQMIERTTMEVAAAMARVGRRVRGKRGRLVVG